MATSISYSNFPANTNIYVTALANASYTQTVTISPPSGSSAVFSGSGEGNVPMSLRTQGFLSTGNGQPYFNPSSSQSTYTINITSSSGLENVQYSVTTNSWSSGATANVLMVVGEDGTDQDYNDAVVLFTWYTPASS